MRTFVYVDGFNLYYGALKGSSWKWLDLVALFDNMLQSHHRIVTVKYFTARVSGTSADQSKPQRQDMDLRALGLVTPGARRPSRQLMAHALFEAHPIQCPGTLAIAGSDSGHANSETRALVGCRSRNL